MTLASVPRTSALRGTIAREYYALSMQLERESFKAAMDFEFKRANQLDRATETLTHVYSAALGEALGYGLDVAIGVR